MIDLRNGLQTSDPRLDRIAQFDGRSRLYTIRALTAPSIRTKVWSYTGSPPHSRKNLDQGREGACVGFGWTQWAICVRKIAFVNQVAGNRFAREKVYWPAQMIDPYPGGDYPGADPKAGGSSVLAGAKIMQQAGLIVAYHWAFTIEDVLQALQVGPLVVGTDWLEGMDQAEDGLIEASGAVRGGHCYLVRGVEFHHKLAKRDDPVLLVSNSWGDGWGVAGDVRILASEFEKLQKAGGEVCVPVWSR